MTNKNPIPNGLYLAKAKSAKITNTTDNVKFVEVDLELIISEFAHKVYLRWRGPLTKGAQKKTLFSLLAMGAKMNTNEKNEVIDILEGVGSKKFMIECVNIECDENEAPGAYKTFVNIRNETNTRSIR